MRAIVIGSAAGGGFPQWNSNGPGCRRARSGDPAAPCRTQTSLALSADGTAWTIINASPDIRAQIEATPALQPSGAAARGSPIAAVLLTGGEVDTIAGLLSLRERQPFLLMAPQSVLDLLQANPIFDVLARDVVRRASVSAETWTEAPGGLRFRLFAVPGKAPLYLEGDAAPPADTTVGVEIAGADGTLFFIPGCAAMTEAMAARLQGAHCVMFDGTLWRDDEMLLAGVGTRTGARMGHMSLSGPDGTLAAFAGLRVGRKILVHLNNTNPVLLADSDERAAVVAAGWEVAHDGLEVTW